MSFLARATKRVSINEEGTYAVGPSLDAIYTAYPWLATGISPEGAMNLVTIYQCVRVLSNTFAQLPLKLYRRRADGGKDDGTDHPLYETLHLRPNPEMTSFAWRRLMMVHLATWGNHYSEIAFDQMGRLQLWPVRPDRVQVSRENGVRVYDYLKPSGGLQRFRPGSVFHVAGMSTDGLKGRSPITDLRGTLLLAKTAETFGESFFRNGARPATILKHPKTLSTEAIGRLAAQMDAMRGAGQAGKTVVLEEGLDFSSIGIPPEDAQFMQTRLFQKREIAGAYGIQLHKIGDLERATFSNIEHQSLEFIQDTMMPWFVLTEQEIAIQLIDDPAYFASFVVDGYLRGDAATRAKALDIQRRNGVINGDEWRALENMNPIPDGSGQPYWMPTMMTAETEEPPDDTGAMREIVPPALRAVKSAEVRCPSCNRKLAELAAPPYRITCGRCKAVAEAEAVA